MKVLENLPLSEITYYHIGGNSRYILKVADKNDLLEAISFLHDKKIKEHLIVGLGSNVIFNDTDYSGAVIWLEGDGSSLELCDESKVRVFAGEFMDSLIQFSFKQSLVGLEWAGGLPSTVGGAVRGNAGCFGSEIKDTVIGVDVIDSSDPTMSIKHYTITESQFAYRDTYFKHHPELIIVSAIFQLQKADDRELTQAKEVYQANIAYRQKNHPMEYPSCGSVFKNIVKKDEVEKILSVWPDVRELSEGKWHNKIAVGYIINRLGFTQRRIGGAMVSAKHSNYIVNVDHAKARDVRLLMKEIHEKFVDTFGFPPEPEVVIIKD